MFSQRFFYSFYIWVTFLCIPFLFDFKISWVITIDKIGEIWLPCSLGRKMEQSFLRWKALGVFVWGCKFEHFLNMNHLGHYFQIKYGKALPIWTLSQKLKEGNKKKTSTLTAWMPRYSLNHSKGNGRRHGRK
jgi:hypothetical protein